MRARDQAAKTSVGDELDGPHSPPSSRPIMTSRGTKYWNSGTIPLIGPDILGEIISEVADIAVVLAEDGVVLSVLSNSAYEPAAKLAAVEGKNFSDILTIESVPKFQNRLAEFLTGDTVRAVELNHADSSQRWEYPVRYSFHKIGPDGAILLLGTDLRPVAEMQQQLVKAQLALERDFEAQREYDTRFRVLMHSTTEPHLFISTANGQITEANPAAAKMLDTPQEELVGKKLSDLVVVSGANDPVEALCARALDGTNLVAAQLKQSERAANIDPTLFRASGERVLLCRIDVGTNVAEKNDDVTRHLRDLHDLGPDGIVFVQADGTVVSSNDGFLDLIGLAHGIDVRGRNIADFMMRGTVDLKVMTENAERFGRMRLYATQIASDYGSPRGVEIAVTRLSAGTSDIFALTIRDSSASSSDRAASGQATDNVESVIELVGNASLKEIVAESTNVIERMCIETALELTMNNRVAAAEMLGLSRQSLYVKLRKLDLVSRED